MRNLNRVIVTVLIILAAAALAAFLRAKGDRHRLGGAVDLAGSMEPVRSEFNSGSDHPRLVMVLAPACPVCLEGANTVYQKVLAERPDLQVLAIWMEALPFDITRNPARRIETFADESRIVHFYDMQQVSGRVLDGLLDWQGQGLPWDVFLFYPAGVEWQEALPAPNAWFHQRVGANAGHFRTGPDLEAALLDAAQHL